MTGKFQNVLSKMENLQLRCSHIHSLEFFRKEILNLDFSASTERDVPTWEKGANSFPCIMIGF
jgi:hypothetical protein